METQHRSDCGKPSTHPSINILWTGPVVTPPALETLRELLLASYAHPSLLCTGSAAERLSRCLLQVEVVVLAMLTAGTQGRKAVAMLLLVVAVAVAAMAWQVVVRWEGRLGVGDMEGLLKVQDPAMDKHQCSHNSSSRACMVGHHRSSSSSKQAGMVAPFPSSSSNNSSSIITSSLLPLAGHERQRGVMGVEDCFVFLSLEGLWQSYLQTESWCHRTLESLGLHTSCIARTYMLCQASYQRWRRADAWV